MGTKSGWHYDLAHNIIVQITGEKHIRLVCPADSQYMHSFIDARHKSQVDPWHPERFPDYRHATVYEGILRAGDVLVLPVLWWHYVTSLSPSISVNCWVDPSTTREFTDQPFPWIRRFKFWVHGWYEFWKAVLGFPRPTRLFSAPSEGVSEGLSWHNWLRSWVRLPPYMDDVTKVLKEKHAQIPTPSSS